MNQKGFTPIFILAGIVLIFVGYFFLAHPNKVSGSAVAPFKNGEIVLSEKISYLFSKPQAGDRVIFLPSRFGQEMAVKGPDFIGIITSVNNNQNITTYTIFSKDKGRPWEVSRDKIIRRIYYPFLNKEDAINTALSLASTYTSTPAPTQQPEATKATQPVSNKAIWKTYINNDLSFKYPSEWSVNETVITSSSPKVRMVVVSKDSTLMNECMERTGEETKNGLIVKKFKRVTTGAMCSTSNSNPREIWVVPSKDAYSPGISYEYSVTEGEQAEEILNQILSTFKFTD